MSKGSVGNNDSFYFLKMTKNVTAKSTNTGTEIFAQSLSNWYLGA